MLRAFAAGKTAAHNGEAEARQAVPIEPGGRRRSAAGLRR